MKKIILFLMFILLFASTANAAENNTYKPFTEPAVYYNIQPAGIRIKYPKGEGRDNIYCNGRLCVSVEEGVRLMGGAYEQQGFTFKITIDGKTTFFTFKSNSNRCSLFTYNNRPFISLYELITPFGYEMLANINENSASVSKYSAQLPTGTRYNRSNKAYIRFEDIAADGMRPDGGGKYTADMLEKLKYMGEYMYNRGYEYYVSWIPVYSYPAYNYMNDVSLTYNLYNSYFLYVMDFLDDHGGHIGIHGYTHQYGTSESGEGYEWGKDTPYSLNEQQERMIDAKTVCRKLGFKEEFFEFPHYEATDEQKRMAENYFDVIYQGYNDGSTNIVYTDRSGKRIYYIPTPCDYVHFKRDYSIYNKIDYCIKNNYMISFYFHPVLDKEKIFIENINGVRVWKFIEEAMLPDIVSYVDGKGYYFTGFDLQ